MQDPKAALTVKMLPTALVAATAVASVVALSGCAAQFPAIAGVWKGDDSSATKTISDDGNCNNLLYVSGKAGQVTPSSTPGMCHIIRTAEGGGYVFQVHQGSTWRNYTATFSKDDSVIALAYHGKHFVTLTKEPGSH